VSAGRGDFQRPLNMLLTLDTNIIVPVTRLLSSDPGMNNIGLKGIDLAIP
jgi:hypothetical protein